MAEARGAVRLDAFTGLGVLVAAWLAVTAYFLFRPTNAGGGRTAASASADEKEPRAAAAAPEAKEPPPATEEGKLLPEEKTAVEKAMKEQPDNPIARIETTEGPILVRLFKDKAPKTVANFIDLIDQKFYDGIIFHRVIKEFMIQTGCPLGRGTGGRKEKGIAEKPLEDEFHPKLRHDRPGVLSMANAGPNTGDTQFFITTVPTPWLDDKHAIFGEVIHGMDVVTKLENVPTGFQDRPNNPPKMVRVRLVDEKEAEAAK